MSRGETVGVAAGARPALTLTLTIINQLFTAWYDVYRWRMGVSRSDCELGYVQQWHIDVNVITKHTELAVTNNKSTSYIHFF